MPVSSIIAGLLIVVVLQAAALIALLINSSRLKRAERALRESEGRFRLMIDRAPVMVWTAKADTTLDFLNQTCVEFTGVPLEQLLGEGWLNLVHPADVDYCTGIYTPAVEARASFVMEYRIRGADGGYRWLLDSGVPMFGPNHGFEGYIGCSIDITERRNAEERIRDSRAALELSHREIQRLAGRLITAQDSERARIARDLHDDVSQQLAGLSIALSGLKHRMSDLQVSDDVQSDVRAFHQRITSLAQSVRLVSHDLHPTVLRHAGLVAALSAYCAELQRAHGASLSCSAEGDFGQLAPHYALCLYRIAQEALRNVIVHSGASRAEVRLINMGDQVEMGIVDDGKGFDLARSIDQGKGLGLISITERARLVGGSVNIVSAPEKGTRVVVRVPTALTEQGKADATDEGRVA